MKILIACEYSGTVREAFKKHGHDVWSCDVLPSDIPGQHIQDDVRNHLLDGWDMMIAFPPCTYLSNAANAFYNVTKYGYKAIERHAKRIFAMRFALDLWEAPIERIAMENPVGFLNDHWMKPMQTVHPCYFGDPDNKRTCFWLKNLPVLQPTKIVKPKIYGYYKKGRHKGKPIYWHDFVSDKRNRGHIKSKFFPGISAAMAQQWSVPWL